MAAGAIDGDEADAGHVPGHLGEESGGGIAGGDDEGAAGEVVKESVGMGRESEVIVGPEGGGAVFDGIGAECSVDIGEPAALLGGMRFPSPFDESSGGADGSSDSTAGGS